MSFVHELPTSDKLGAKLNNRLRIERESVCVCVIPKREVAPGETRIVNLIKFPGNTSLAVRIRTYVLRRSIEVSLHVSRQFPRKLRKYFNFHLSTRQFPTLSESRSKTILINASFCKSAESSGKEVKFHGSIIQFQLTIVSRGIKWPRF